MRLTAECCAGVGLLEVEEDRGGWGEWVPLIPDTPQPPTAAVEAAEAAEQVNSCCMLTILAVRLQVLTSIVCMPKKRLSCLHNASLSRPQVCQCARMCTTPCVALAWHSSVYKFQTIRMAQETIDAIVAKHHLMLIETCHSQKLSKIAQLSNAWC